VSKRFSKEYVTVLVSICLLLAELINQKQREGSKTKRKTEKKTL